MKINVWKSEVSALAREPEKARAYFDKEGWWNASIDGPWYDDSNPYGRGHTEEEARQKALAALKEMHEEIGRFLREQGVISS